MAVETSRQEYVGRGRYSQVSGDIGKVGRYRHVMVKGGEEVNWLEVVRSIGTYEDMYNRW